MGFTELAEAAVWNTFPPHTHNRRTEIYFYLIWRRVLAHFMGEPAATRHLWIQNEQAVLSPSWSIHSGCGHVQLQIHLGHGRRKPDVRRHGRGETG